MASAGTANPAAVGAFDSRQSLARSVDSSERGITIIGRAALLEVKERQSEQNERGNQRAPSEHAGVSSAIGSIRGVIATIVVSFSLGTDWSTPVTPVCSE